MRWAITFSIMSYKGLVMYGVLIVIGFAFLNWGINFALARWGAKWDIRGITDVAVLPLAVIVFSLFFFRNYADRQLPSLAPWSTKRTCTG